MESILDPLGVRIEPRYFLTFPKYTHRPTWADSNGVEANSVKYNDDLGKLVQMYSLSESKTRLTDYYRSTDIIIRGTINCRGEWSRSLSLPPLKLKAQPL